MGGEWCYQLLVLATADSFQGCGDHIEEVRQVLCHLKDGLTYSASGVARCAQREQVYL